MFIPTNCIEVLHSARKMKGAINREPNRWCKYRDASALECERFHAPRSTLHAFLALPFALSLSAADVDITKLPPPAQKKIDFTQDVKPILEKSCIRCHGPEKPKSKFRLDNRESALQGGENNREDIVPGQSGRSPLIHYVAGLVEDMKMPPPGKGEPLTTEQIGVLRAWIDQGLVWETNAPRPATELTLTPTMRWISVHGNEQVFREQAWTREGGNAGVEHFEVKEKTGEHSTTSLEGRVLRDDFRVALTLEQEEFGFARVGAQRYRKYFSDTGGYYPLFPRPAFSLNRDLHLDSGSAWVDFGLTLPDWPRMVAGYEYQFKQGEKSSLQWGSVVSGVEGNGDPRARNILPSAKEIDERVHILKFDLEHDIRGVRIENSFRGEFYDLATRRTNLNFTTGFLQSDAVREGYHHFQGANSFRLEKQFAAWLFGSAGCLYSKLNGDASFNLDEMNVGPLPGSTQQWRSQQIVLERESHVINANALFGPWDGLTLSTGVQSEWTRQKSLGEANLAVFDGEGLPFLPATSVALRSDLDKVTVEERLSLHYTKIPFTSLFAEVRGQQESLGQFEDQVGNPLNDFLRNTDTDSDLKDFRVGFNTSPWRRVSFNASYRHSKKANHYNHFLDTTPGYSAFIRSLGRISDEVETKLVLHPVAWFKSTLGVKWVETDYHTATDPAGDGVSPGGRLQAGNYHGLIPSVNFTLTPWQRLYWSGTFTCQDSRTSTAANNSPAIVPYKGQIYSALASGTFAWNARTDLRVSYSFSHADYGQNNFADGLPVGMRYWRHWVQTGISRHFRKNLTGNLHYGFSVYDERGHFNNYTAHGLFASLAMNWP